MVSSDLGACEWFVWDLRRSGLIDRGQLDQVIGEFLKKNPRAEPPALAEYLVGQGVLSPFQAERILQGKTQGLVLGPYVLVDTIGSGSMGQVYKASSKTDNAWYAVKVLPRRSMWNVRLARRQVRAFSQFSHPAVVPFVDVGTSGGLHYLVWPIIEGETLETRVNREGRLPQDVSAQIMLQVAQGLTVCHQHGIFHGLIKPSNLMIGFDQQARLLDFGIGSLLVENEGESLVDTMSTANTFTSGLDCTSPESIMEPTNRTPAGDQYSLGCTLYYCLTGRYPFPDGTAVEKMMAHQFKQPTPIRELVPNINESLVEVVERLMQKAPENRYTGADELVEALQPLTVMTVPAPRVVAKPAAPQRQPEAPRTVAAPAPMPRVNNTPIPAPAPYAPTTPPNVAPPTYGPLPGVSQPPMPSRSPSVGGYSPPGGNRPQPQAQPPVISAQRPTIPTRAAVSVAPEPPMIPEMMPHSPPVTTPYQAPQPAPLPRTEAGPAWNSEPTRPGAFGPLLVIAVAALVTVGVYFLGKNFIVPAP